MKHKIWYSLAALMLFFTSCTPIDDRESMGQLLTASQIK
jgi:hypothetical protein